jgi:hypothetical protein
MSLELKNLSRALSHPLVEPNHTQPIAENRVLLGALFVAVALLGPAFTLGYFSGFRLGQAGDLRGAPRVAAPAEILPRQTPQAGTKQQPPEPPTPVAPVSNQVAAAPAEQAAAGQIYLQLAASAKGQSAITIDALRKQGFRAIAREVPERPELYRVLIGPLREGDLDKTRADLQNKSFPGATAITRTF